MTLQCEQDKEVQLQGARRCAHVEEDTPGHMTQNCFVSSQTAAALGKPFSPNGYYSISQSAQGEAWRGLLSAPPPAGLALVSSSLRALSSPASFTHPCHIAHLYRNVLQGE